MQLVEWSALDERLNDLFGARVLTVPQLFLITLTSLIVLICYIYYFKYTLLEIIVA